MRRILTAVAISAAAAPLALLGTAGSAHAGEHGGDCDPTRGVSYCPTPPQPSPQNFNLILGTRRDDTIFGSRGDDAILAFAGNDRVVTRGGNDVVYGGRGNDTLIDNSPEFFGNVATLRGGSGNDLCIGNVNDRFLNCETVIIL
jgi:Ca2+-binding RTX toxin-like protein